MNRALLLTGIALSAAVTLTGCGGTKKAGTVAESASAKARHRSPGAAPAASATVPGTVRVGGYCKTTGTVGRTTTGAWARCQKKPGDKRARWHSAGPAQGGARAGQFCSREGSTAKSSNGKKLTCTKKRGDARPRWRVK
jgi:hypothetical protein